MEKTYEIIMQPTAGHGLITINVKGDRLVDNDSGSVSIFKKGDLVGVVPATALVYLKG